MTELTDTPDHLPAPGAEPPDFGEFDDPEDVLKGGSTRERLLDVIMQLRDPEKVSTIADRAGCDTETAREYLEWFESMGMVREFSARPVTYSRNDSYLRWRRVERIREQYSDEEIVEKLMETLEEIGAHRDRFDADTPGTVSLVDVSREMSVEEAWTEISEWVTLERRAALLDAARGDESTGSSVGRVDA